MGKKLAYHQTVDYSLADPAKILAQNEAAATSKNMPFGFTELAGTRGESAYVFDMGEYYGALVQEGLGTKSLIAQSIYKDSGVSHFKAVAKDTVATFINDLISVGATPVVTNAYWSSGSYEWLGDKKLSEDFITGWREACDEAGIVWGGGETQSLNGIIKDDALEMGGSAFGIIKPKANLVSETRLSAGDTIVIIGSSGVHANGISLTRQIAESLPEGYDTKLPSGGRTYGEALMVPTHLYGELVDKLLKADLDVHYLSNITGHGWRKIMRATTEFTYIIENLPPVAEIFDFIAEKSGNNTEEMYGNYNMGAGYAVYLPEKNAQKAVDIARSCGLEAIIAGKVQEGPKKLVIQPKDITYGGESLKLR